MAQEIGVDGELEALVLEVQPNRIQVLLTGTLLTGDFPLDRASRYSQAT
ncbi:MAG: hypothetical protein ACQES8_08695 [Thermodesulfobacteriota bacterium]